MSKNLDSTSVSAPPQVSEKDTLILSQQKQLIELSEHSLQMQKSIEEKDACIVSQQKALSELTNNSNELLKDLRDTRKYFNQVWREYSQARNRFYRLRMNKWVGWIVDRDSCLSPGEKTLKSLSHERDKHNPKKSSQSENFKQLNSEAGVYNGVPHTIILDVTAQCNLQCIMCFQSSMKNTDFVFGELTDKSISNSAQFISTANEVKLFATGEPFLSSGLKGIVDVLYGNVENITISTNGTIYNDNVKHIIHRLSTLTVSLDSASKEKFEIIRKKSNFSHIINNISRIRSEQPNLFMTFAVTVARYNLDECPEIIHLAAGLKINHVQFSSMRSLEPRMQAEELCEEDAEWIKRVRLLVEEATKQASITMEWQV